MFTRSEFIGTCARLEIKKLHKAMEIRLMFIIILMAIDAVPEARSYIVNRNGKGKSNGKGLAWRKLKRQNTAIGLKESLEADRIAGLRPCEVTC